MLTRNVQTPILMYHSVSETDNAKFYPFTVSPQLFAEQMAYLYSCGYTPITVTQYAKAYLGGDFALPKHPVVLTFDDGFEDFFTNALPVLNRYHFPATVYISTGFVGKTSAWLCRERETMRPMLTWEQIVQMDQAGIECGGHTHTHPQLDTLRESEAFDEIVRCKEILEEVLGHQVESFAYPFGYYTSAVQKLISLAGYTSACAVHHRMSTSDTHPLALTRFMVTPETTVDAFSQLLAGTGLSMAEALYLRLRTPVWAGLRRGLAHINRFFKEDISQYVIKHI